jgi:methylmalonyl-CoA mutase N-terminal domain/subunit
MQLEPSPEANAPIDRIWRESYAVSAARDVPFTTLSGEPIRPLYTEADLPAGEEIGLPGQFPFTRGVYPSMYRGRLWTMRQFAGFGTAEETNERFRYLLGHGQRASRPRSTCRRCWATTPTIRARGARWVARG